MARNVTAWGELEKQRSTPLLMISRDNPHAHCWLMFDTIAAEIASTLVLVSSFYIHNYIHGEYPIACMNIGGKLSIY